MEISGLGMQSVNKNPDSYAKIYAEQNNISLSEAKEELKEKYGDPSQGCIMNFQNNSYSNSDSFSFSNSATSPIGSMDSKPAETESNGFLKNLLGIFKGHKAENENNGETGQGPRIQGDFNPTNENPFGVGQGPRMQGDFNPTNENPFGTGEGPKTQGDFNPTAENPFKTQQDPNSYAQVYANMKGISLDDAKVELKEMYGSPATEE